MQFGPSFSKRSPASRRPRRSFLGLAVIFITLPKEATDHWTEYKVSARQSLRGGKFGQQNLVAVNSQLHIAETKIFGTSSPCFFSEPARGAMSHHYRASISVSRRPAGATRDSDTTTLAFLGDFGTKIRGTQRRSELAGLRCWHFTESGAKSGAYNPCTRL